MKQNKLNQAAWNIGWITLLMLITGSTYAITLMQSDPAYRRYLSTPPTQIHLRFSEEVNPTNISLSVYTDDGNQVTDATPQVATGDPTSIVLPLPALTPGFYTVEYYVTSTNGQSSSGEYKFRVIEEKNSTPEISTQTLIDTETVLNWAENTYTELFSDHQITQNIEPWLFRHYPQTGIYAGVNTSDLNIYVLGGPWGNNPVFIDSLSNLLVLIVSSNDNSGNNNNRTPTCDTANTPTGLLYTQNGNIVNVTTNGECIPIPENTNLCPLPPQPSATGTSLLTTFTQTSSSITTGIESNGRMVRESLPTSEMLRTKYCTINAPEEAIDLIVHADFCYDMTVEFMGRSFSSITINPPVTFATKGVFEHKRINSRSSCFDYEASIITDAVTGEVWKRQEGGSYIKVRN